MPLPTPANHGLPDDATIAVPLPADGLDLFRLLRDDDPRPREHGDAVGEPFRLPGHAIRALSPREHDVLQLLTDGLSNREIAAALGISETTVKAHLRRVREKLRLATPALRRRSATNPSRA